MRAGDVGRLIALSAIWGASFLFIRVTAPAIGPIATADLRMLIGGAALAVYFRAIGFDPQWRRWSVQYAIVGMLTSGFPFLLYSYAALELSAGVLAIAAALTAPFLYGFTGVYLKRSVAGGAPARGMAVGTQLMAGVLVLPFLALSPPPVAPTLLIAANVAALGLLCSGAAYLLYFRLIADIGATRALTVTYLIPVFGVLWGALFLNETISPSMLSGGVLVLLGTFFVLRK